MNVLLLRRAAACAVALALSCGPVLASTDSPAPDQVKPLQSRATSAGLVLVKTIIKSAPAASVALTAGFNTLDTTTLFCNNSAGCTFGFQTLAQVSIPAGTLWAVCNAVDGVYVNPGCPYQGSVPDAGTYVAGTYLGNQVVASGKHVLTTQVYVSGDGTLGEWQASYSSFK